MDDEGIICGLMGEKMRRGLVCLLIVIYSISLFNVGIIGNDTTEPTEQLTQEEVEEKLDDLGTTFYGHDEEAAMRELLEKLDPDVAAAFTALREEKGYYTNEKGEKLNRDLYMEYGILAFGTTEDGPMTGPEPKGEPKYIGTNFWGDKISNYKYPYEKDPPAGANFSNYEWYSDVHDNSAVTGPYPYITESPYSASDYIDEFKKGIELQHGMYYEDTGLDWTPHIHVLTPPTEHSNGLARLFFKSKVDSSTRYIDVILVATAITNGGASMTITHDGNDVTNGVIEVSEKDKEDITIEVTVDSSLSNAETIHWSGGSLMPTTSTGTTTQNDTLFFGTTSMNYTATFESSDPNQKVADPVSAGVTIKLIEHKEDEIDIVLNYNELGKKFTIGMSQATIDFTPPNDFSAWVDPIVAFYNAVAISNGKLNEDLVIEPLYAFGSTAVNSASVSPVISFTTYREHFGDKPETVGGHSGNGSAVDSFNITASGSSSRRYEPEFFTPIFDPITGDITNYSSTSASFNPTVDTNVNVTALIYNGLPYGPSPSISTGEMVINEHFSRGIEWRGHPIGFKVSRDMIDAEGNTIEVPGQYTRYFVPDNHATVTFQPGTSWFIDRYRTIAGRPILGMIINAPFTTDTESQDYYTNNGILSVKSGYFYEIQGSYTATITTTVYTRSGDTSHDDLVQSVRDGFRVISNIPTVFDPNERVEHLPYYDINNDQILDVTRTITSNTVSTTQMSDSKYGPFMEQTGDKLYFEQLSSLESLGAINEVVETTVITFDLPIQKRYIHINAPDETYFIKGYLRNFSLPNAHIGGSYTGDLSVAELPKGIEIESPANNALFFGEGYSYYFRVNGNMYEDTNQSD